MRFASLGSGSRGNAVLVNFGSTLLMVDCGLSLRAAKTRMDMLDCAPADVSALLVTHEHSDHIQGVATLATRHDVPVWMTPGTAMSPAVRKLSHVNRLRSDEALEIGSIRVQPFPVPHDAREPAQFSFEAGGRKLGVLTDTGYITPHIRMRLEGCDAIAVEFNHDLDSLRRGPYPPHVKDRIASSLGHLSNDQAAQLMADVAHPGLQWIAALHLSGKNNTPGLVRETLARSLPGEYPLHIADQDQPIGWIPID